LKRLHIANTDLEFELAQTQDIPLEQALRRNPIVHQLQFLPLLYKEHADGVCVTDPPMDESAYHLFSERDLSYDVVEPSVRRNPAPLGAGQDELSVKGVEGDVRSPTSLNRRRISPLDGGVLQSWGASKAVARWAKLHNLTYHMPPWEVVREVNSKAFSFQQVDPLPQGELIYAWSDLESWMKKTEGPRVLKTCFGLSGQGHLLLPAPFEKIKSFAEKEFQASRPVIAEPWVVRKLDFSTQWVIGQDKSITFLGATILQSDEKGRYSGNLIGANIELNEHKEAAIEALEKMAAMGYFGNVGIDAMIWGSDVLHPIVEINARKTMGFVALEIRKRLFPNQTIRVSYVAQGTSKPLLPQGIIKPNGEVMKFHRNLYIDVY
jgi:hypothetical protein